MGQGTTRLEPSNGTTARVRQLGQETEEVRRELDGLVSELDRRRHRALDWRRQIRRHRRALALIAGGIVVAVGLVVTASIARRRRHQGLATQLFELAKREHLVQRALSSLADGAERVEASRPSSCRLDASTALSLLKGMSHVLLPLIALPSARALNRVEAKLVGRSSTAMPCSR